MEIANTEKNRLKKEIKRKTNETFKELHFLRKTEATYRWQVKLCHPISKVTLGFSSTAPESALPLHIQNRNCFALVYKSAHCGGRFHCATSAEYFQL